MINNIQQTPTISQHKRRTDSTSISKPSVSSSACVKKNEIKREPAEINFCGFFKQEKMTDALKKEKAKLKSAKIDKLLDNKTINTLLQSKRFHKILEVADGKSAVFQASFALILTCGLRPLSIMLMPSKKNKDDQTYASAHSIASGVIGWVFSSILLSPFNNAFKKVANNMKGYIDANSYLAKNKQAENTAKTFVKRLTDWVPAIPKGILTIALIPPILKYVFGIQKKKNGNNVHDALTKPDYSLLNFKSNEEGKNKILSKSLGGNK